MPGFIASCHNPKTGTTETSEVDTLYEAQIRARTLRTMEKVEDRPGCVCRATGPNDEAWTFRPNASGIGETWTKD